MKLAATSFLAAAVLVATLTAQTAGSLYTCSMDPGIVETHPGKCPVCSMTLKARPMTTDEQSVIALFAAYDAAFSAKDLKKLADFYTFDTTVYEGGTVNTGWEDYRDHHLAPELQAYSALKFAHADVAPHLAGNNGYVTAEYSISATTNGQPANGGGLATYQVVKEDGAWKISHTHTSAKRR